MVQSPTITIPRPSALPLVSSQPGLGADLICLFGPCACPCCSPGSTQGFIFTRSLCLSLARAQGPGVLPLTQ